MLFSEREQCYILYQRLGFLSAEDGLDLIAYLAISVKNDPHVLWAISLGPENV